jgi:hypothetical protein
MRDETGAARQKGGEVGMPARKDSPVDFMLAVIWRVQLEFHLRALGIRTDVEVEGPRRDADKNFKE